VIIFVEQIAADEDWELFLHQTFDSLGFQTRFAKSQQQFRQRGRANVLRHHQRISQVERWGLEDTAQQSQWIKCCRSTMLYCNDVIDLMRRTGIVSGNKQYSQRSFARRRT
jgi:hypothetical protein